MFSNLRSILFLTPARTQVLLQLQPKCDAFFLLPFNAQKEINRNVNFYPIAWRTLISAPPFFLSRCGRKIHTRPGCYCQGIELISSRVTPRILVDTCNLGLGAEGV